MCCAVFFYYPFGMIIPNKKFSAGTGYRYGFNGKENDNEPKGEANQQDYGMRISDPRLGRFLSVDPLTSSYPSWSPYPFAMNNPIAGIDLDGLEFYYTVDGKYLGQGNEKGNTEVRLAKLDRETAEENYVSAVDKNGKPAKDWVVVHPNHETFKRFAAMVYEESAGDKITGETAVDKREGFAIASATMNYIKSSKDVGLNYELEDVLKYKAHSSAINTEGFKRYLDGGYKKNWRDANAAAINALVGGFDHSYGAIKWDGFDFARDGTEHSHYSWGLEINKAHYESFMGAMKSYWGDVRYSTKATVISDEELKSKTPTLASSVSYGRSIFWKYTNDPKAKFALKDIITHETISNARKARLNPPKPKVKAKTK
jgi:RHS repeat-associated protein